MSNKRIEADAEGCQCEPCTNTGPHSSDCAYHGADTGNGITYDGPCTCAMSKGHTKGFTFNHEDWCNIFKNDGGCSCGKMSTLSGDA